MKRQANALGRFRKLRSCFLLKTIIALEIGFLLLLGSGDRAVSQSPETSQVVNSSSIPARRTIQCEGWTLHVSEELYANEAELLEKALHLLEKQLQEIVRVVPPAISTQVALPMTNRLN